MWTEHVLNPKLIQGIFKNEKPSLKQIRMKEIAVIFGSDLLCRIHFDLKDFPVEAPLKWIQSKYNKVQMSLALLNTDIVHFSAHGGDIEGDLSIIFDKSYFTIEFRDNTNELIFSATSKWINIDKISGYISSI